MNCSASIRFLVLAAGLTAACAAQAAPRLVVGMTLPLTGPEAPFGQALREGAQLAVVRANGTGGVGGRLIELAVRDDGGDARRAAANARELLDSEALALAAVLGDASTAAVAQVLAPSADGPPLAALVAPISGADRLRDPVPRGVFHLRAGHAEQAVAALLHLDTLGIERYAMLTQDDATGRGVLERLHVELMRIAMRPVAALQLPAAAGPPAVQQALVTICKPEPQALVFALDVALAAEALRLSQAQRCGGQRLVFSETGAVLAARIPPDGAPHPFANVLVTQVVPHPNERQHPLVNEFQLARSAYGRVSNSHGALEGYLALRVVIEALGACQRELDRKCLLQVLASRSFDLPGLKVAFGRAQRQQRPFVEINMIDAHGRLRH